MQPGYHYAAVEKRKKRRSLVIDAPALILNACQDPVPGTSEDVGDLRRIDVENGVLNTALPLGVSLVRSWITLPQLFRENGKDTLDGPQVARIRRSNKLPDSLAQEVRVKHALRGAAADGCSG